MAIYFCYASLKICEKGGYGISKLRTISTFGILACTVAIAVILLVTYFGENVGDFTLGIQDDFESRSYLSLSEDISFKDSTSMLVAKSYDNAKPIGSLDFNENPLPQDINKLLLPQEDGSKNAFKGGSLNGDGFMTYTCYLKNVGNDACNYVYSINIATATNNIDAAIRVMVIHEKDTTSIASNPKSVIYAKAQGENQVNVGQAEKWTQKFVSDNVICEEEEVDFYAGSIDKFTVILWIEGWDIDATNVGPNSIVGGVIKLSMKFRMVERDESAI